MSLGDFDFREMKQLKANLTKLQASYPAFVDECIRELAGRLLAKTVARTPVDTGHLRRSWTVGEVVHLTGGGVQVEIINPVEYAMYVEFGHRTASHTGWVDGRFMLTVSVQELEREMPAIIDRKFQAWLKRMGW